MLVIIGKFYKKIKFIDISINVLKVLNNTKI